MLFFARSIGKSLTRTNPNFLGCSICCNYNFLSGGTHKSRNETEFRYYSFSSFYKFIVESNACAYSKDLFTGFHDLTGFSWWSVIAISGFALKIVSMPLKIYQGNVMSRLDVVEGELAKIRKKVMAETLEKQKYYLWPPKKAKMVFMLEMRNHKQNLVEKYNCHPAKAILVNYFELPVWFVWSVTWRTMAYGFSHDITSSNILSQQMSVEGLWWCSNLTLTDSTYVLPFLIFLSHTMVLELAILKVKHSNKLFNVSITFGRVFSVLGPVICSFMPSSVGIFWLSSSFATFMREILLLSPRVKNFLGYQTSINESVTYEDLIERFKKRWFIWGKGENRMN